MVLTLVLSCGVAAAAEPLTTCRDAKGFTLDAGANIPALGRVLRAREGAKGAFVLEVNDGREWTLSQEEGVVIVSSGAVEALACEGAIAREVLLSLTRATTALAPRKKVGLCRRMNGGKRFESPVSVGTVLSGGAVEVKLFSDEERQWTLVLTSLEPVTGTAARCFSSAGRHCEAASLPTFDWQGRATITVKDDNETARLECNLDKESLVRLIR